MPDESVSSGASPTPGWLSESMASTASTMSASPAATWPEIGPSSPMKKVMEKMKSATGTRTAPAPNDTFRAWPTALVTTAPEGTVTETNIAMARTARTTPRISRSTSVRTRAGAFAALDLPPRPLAGFFAAFLLRLEGIN